MKKIKYHFQGWASRFEQLPGDPHYIAMGMAVGVFISVTPTIPFHSVLAIALAFILRGSKIAAAIGVWLSNPVTMPFIYLGSYKVGMFLLGNSATLDAENQSGLQLLKLGVDVTYAMTIGAAILGFPLSVASYFITRKIAATIHLSRKTMNKQP